MAKKLTKLSVVNKPTQTQEERDKEAARDKEYDRWEKAEKSWRITAADARGRVLALRDKLESYRQQLEGVPFGMASGDANPPLSLDGGEREYAIYLAMDLNPIVYELFEEIDAFALKHGSELYRLLDFQSKLFDLRSESVDTGFRVGMLAGVIFSGASKETVDRFERGLAYDMKCNNCVVKD
jgi:hypothetical protein